MVVEATYVHQNSDRKVTRQPDSHSICYQPAVETVQLEALIERVVCDNTADNCQKLAKLANQLPCVYTEIRISYLHL